MYPHLRLAFASAALCLAAVSCGAAHGPSSPTPPPVSLAGDWLGEQTLTDAEGADCLQSVFDGLIGLPTQFHATITQDADRVTATMDVDHTGAECMYAGTIQIDHLTLNSTSCSEPTTVGLMCASGERRDLRPIAGSLILALGASPLQGAVIENDDVLESETARHVDTLFAIGRVTLTRR